MNRYCLLLGGLPLVGCLSSKVGPTQADPAFMLVQDNGQPRISSLSSAIQTPITKSQRVGDTLRITYRKKGFSPSQANGARSIIPLDDQTKYVQCANRRFRVVKTGQGFMLEQLK